MEDAVESLPDITPQRLALELADAEIAANDNFSPPWRVVMS
jgi:hypothetical protein